MRRFSAFMITVAATLTACFGQPVATKVFNPSSVFPGQRSTITFDVTNPSTTVTLTGVTFTDNLPGGLVVASPNNINGFCTGGSAGVANGNAGGTTTALLNTTLVPSSHCTYNIDVIAPATPGVINNTTGPVQSSAGLGTPGTASLTVLQLLVLTKSFGVVSMGPGTTTTLTFNLRNPNASSVTTIGFADTLPTGLVVATPNGLTGSCDAGTITAVAGSNSIALAGATLAGGASCTFSVAVTADGAALNLVTNTTGPVLSGTIVAGAAATASIFIGAPFQVSYFPNVNIADSVINATNTGARGAGFASGTSAATTGAFCLNAYAFSPDEQMVACCTCPVTPNGLVSLSVKNDLLSNTLTPAVPTSVVVKLTATVPVGGACVGSAASVALTNLSPGLAAWGTKVHPIGTGAGITETPFSGAILSQGEMDRLATLCTFIISNGSGFGICRSCRLGGQGAVGQ
jgi:uncharacterized repeat protein (TIGR01451 family)